MKLICVFLSALVFSGNAAPAEEISSTVNWQEQLEKQLLAGAVLKEAAIVAPNGDILAKSANFQGSVSELQTIISKFSTREVFQQNGIVIGGVKYIYLSGSERVMRGKKSKAGIHIMKTGNVFLIGAYDEPTIAQQAAVVVEKLGDSLLSRGL